MWRVCMGVCVHVAYMHERVCVTRVRCCNSVWRAFGVRRARVYVVCVCACGVCVWVKTRRATRHAHNTQLIFIFACRVACGWCDV